MEGGGEGRTLAFVARRVRFFLLPPVPKERVESTKRDGPRARAPRDVRRVSEEFPSLLDRECPRTFRSGAVAPSHCRCPRRRQ